MLNSSGLLGFWELGLAQLACFCIWKLLPEAVIEPLELLPLGQRQDSHLAKLEKVRKAGHFPHCQEAWGSYRGPLLGWGFCTEAGL